MNPAELDRMAQAELEEEGFVLFADPLRQAQLEPPRTAGTAKTAAQWALLVVLVVLDVLMAVAGQ